MKKLLFAVSLTAIVGLAAPANAASVTVDNCGKPITFAKTPDRIVVHDMNMTDMAFALGLQDKIVGLTGITGWYKTSPEFDKLRGDIPELAPKYPTMENLVAANPEMFFAGWYYGMKPGGDVTPESLAKFNIKTLVLSESCIHMDKKRPAASMDLLFNDVVRLGKVMDVEDKANGLVKDWKVRLAALQDKMSGAETSRVFLLDGIADKPFTSGQYAIPDAMIAAAGGKNIMHDMKTSWGRSSWEVVAERNPEFLVLLDYQTGNGAADLFKFLQQHPAMSKTEAVKNNRWIGLRYEELTPGPANIKAIEKMAKAMHPERF